MLCSNNPPRRIPALTDGTSALERTAARAQEAGPRPFVPVAASDWTNTAADAHPTTQEACLMTPRCCMGMKGGEQSSSTPAVRLCDHGIQGAVLPEADIPKRNQCPHSENQEESNPGQTLQSDAGRHANRFAPSPSASKTPTFHRIYTRSDAAARFAVLKPRQEGERKAAQCFPLSSLPMALRALPALNQVIWLSLKVWFTGNS